MTELDILHSTYKSFYTTLKTTQNFVAKDFLNGNLGDFTGAILEDWCGPLFLVSAEHASVKDSDHTILFTVSANHNERVMIKNVSYVPAKTRIGFLCNGDIVTFDRVTEKTGGKTYTGDTYIDTYMRTYTIKETLYKSELFNEFGSLDDVTSEQVEAVAVEVAQEIIELHEQPKFHV